MPTQTIHINIKLVKQYHFYYQMNVALLLLRISFVFNTPLCRLSEDFVLFILFWVFFLDLRIHVARQFWNLFRLSRHGVFSILSFVFYLGLSLHTFQATLPFSVSFNLFCYSCLYILMLISEDFLQTCHLVDSFSFQCLFTPSTEFLNLNHYLFVRVPCS